MFCGDKIDNDEKVDLSKVQIPQADEQQRALRWSQRVEGTPFGRLLKSAETEVRLTPVEDRTTGTSPDGPHPSSAAATEPWTTGCNPNASGRTRAMRSATRHRSNHQQQGGCQNQRSKRQSFQ